MTFLAADTGAPAGGAAAAEDPNATAAQPVDYKALLLSLLGLAPVATDEEISAKQAEVSGTLGTVGDLQTKASTADQLQQQYDDLQKQYQDLNAKQEEIWKQKQQAEADEILKVYEGHFTDEASKGAIRNILLSDKDAGIAILNGLKKPEAPADADASAATDKSKATPPAPQHDPNAPAVKTDEEKIAEQNALIKAIQKEGKFKDYEAARAEARRRQADLFS